jgi:hypothetical protein
LSATAKPMTKISLPAARLAIAVAAAVIPLLNSLHMLGLEFDPAWRVSNDCRPAGNQTEQSKFIIDKVSG